MKSLRVTLIAVVALAAVLLPARLPGAGIGAAMRAEPHPEAGGMPVPADYPVARIPAGLISEPILDTPVKTYFRTRLREGASRGSNFGGHYALLEWGCEQGCATFFIVDELSGRVFDPGFRLTAPRSGPDQSFGFTYRPDSRLLVVRGCRNNAAASCGTSYMLWTGSSLNTLARVPLPSEIAAASGMQ